MGITIADSEISIEKRKVVKDSKINETIISASSKLIHIQWHYYVKKGWQEVKNLLLSLDESSILHVILHLQI